MQIVPLSANPNETLQIVLAGQNCSIELRSLDGYAITDEVTFDEAKRYVAFTLDVSGVSITRSQNCLNLKRLLLNRQYLGFVGDFMFIDTQPPPGTSGEDPQYEGLGTRWLLMYIEESDLIAAVLANGATAPFESRPGVPPAPVPPPPAPPSGSNLVITAGQVGNPCCACDPNVIFGFLDPTVGFTALGTTTTPNILGHALSAFSWTNGSGDVNVTLEGTLPQNFFTSLEITDSSIGDLTFTTAAATWVQTMAPDGITPITQWAWSTAQPFTNGQTYHANVT